MVVGKVSDRFTIKLLGGMAQQHYFAYIAMKQVKSNKGKGRRTLDWKDLTEEQKEFHLKKKEEEQRLQDRKRGYAVLQERGNKMSSKDDGG